MRPDKTRDTITEFSADGDEAGTSQRVQTPAGPGSRFVLERRGGRVSLRPGSILVGRGGSCQLVIDDSLVSRRHALIVVKSEGVKIKDLGSANGVYVNGSRIQESIELRAGDRVLIGQEEMVLQVRRASISEPASRAGRLMAETLHGEVVGLPEAVPVVVSRASAIDQDAEATQQGQALELLGGVAEKVLALGRGDEAERIMANCLQSLLQKAKDTGAVDLEVAEKATNYALKLAVATGKGRWVDYGFEMYLVLKRPLPSEIVDQLYNLLRTISGFSLTLLSEYVAALHAVQARFGPNDRFLTHRIEGLERLVK